LLPPVTLRFSAKTCQATGCWTDSGRRKGRRNFGVSAIRIASEIYNAIHDNVATKTDLDHAVAIAECRAAWPDVPGAFFCGFGNECEMAHTQLANEMLQ
jgi:hypothetical protein